ncbi:MAG: potassium transporter TrkA [Chloroflexi bacterium RBG_19FT_COMBO_55_16]|nr:MAG: potassium transporter TrkA [Chloroflexi bacterium RBG_19FT_COMBO_55_16]
MNVIIVGGGKTGSQLAMQLIDAGHRVKVIEDRAEVLERLQQEMPEGVVIAGDGSAPSVLEAAGIKAAQVLAAVTGDDEANLVITTLARFEFKVPRTIARVNNPKNSWLFNEQMGVDVALNQADILAKLIAEEMSLGDMMTLLKLRRGEYSIVEEKVHPRAVVAGKPIREIDLPPECVLVAILRKNQLIVPHGDTVLQPVDEVIALVHASKLVKLASLLGPLE